MPATPPLVDPNLYWLYWTIFGAYLAFLAAAGIYAKKKTQTLEDFMVAGRSINALLLGLSFGATYFSAVLIVGGGEQAYSWGLGSIWIAAIDMVIGVFAIFIIFGRRTKILADKFGAMTIPDLLAGRYQDKGNRLRILTALTILIFETVYIVSIYMGLSYLLQVMLPDVPEAFPIAVIICGIVTVFYLWVGGSHGAIWTDVIESMIMIVGVVLIAVFGLIAIGGIGPLNETLYDANPGMTTFIGAGGFGIVGYCFVTAFGVWGNPAMISRFYTAQKKKTIKWGLVISCTWAFVIAIFAWLNGAIGRAYFLENPTTGVTAKYVIPYMMVSVMPLAFAALFLGAVAAASLTTAEKVILMSASAFSRDIYQKVLKKDATDAQTLRMTRIMTLIVTLVATIFTLFQPGAVLALCMFAWAAMSAVILVPYIFGLFWKGGTRDAAFWSGIISLATALLWYFLFRADSAGFGAIFPLLSQGATSIGKTQLFGIMVGDVPLTLASIHEFIASQVVAFIAFPIISKFTKKPEPAFVDEVMKDLKK
jgi:SSS family solute:Na+ symporter